MAAGGDSSLPNNPESGPNQTFPEPNGNIDDSFAQGNRGSYDPVSHTISLPRYWLPEHRWEVCRGREVV